MALIKCIRCGAEAFALNKSRKYCGSELQKNGCAYKVRIERNEAAKLRKRARYKKVVVPATGKSYDQYLLEYHLKTKPLAIAQKAVAENTALRGYRVAKGLGM